MGKYWARCIIFLGKVTQKKEKYHTWYRVKWVLCAHSLNVVSSCFQAFHAVINLFYFFILILFSNYVGLLPLAGHLPGYKPPTSNLSVTAALALIVLISYFVLGIRYGGKKFLKFYFGPMILVNLLETITRPLSLALRLYGNIFGEEMIILILFSMVPLFLPLPMYLLSIMFGGIQAFVFTLLTAVYLEEALSGGH